MSFQTSCMVLVRDEQQQIKLEKWVKGIGRQIIGGRQDWSNFFWPTQTRHAFGCNSTKMIWDCLTKTFTTATKISKCSRHWRP